MRLRAFAFLADENIHPEVIDFLHQEACDVRTVDELNLRGARDEQILTTALSEQRLVLTHDSDFGTLMVAARQLLFGILYLRPGHIRAEFTIAMLRTLLESSLDLTPPFLLVARRKDNVIRVRLRPLHPIA